jgi:xanthine dehydrogenase accessory factor
MACESEGAMEVYLEPNLPTAQVVVIGRSPAVDTLAATARAAGWSAVIIDDGGDPYEHADPEMVRTKLDLSGVSIDQATAIVVATQGHYDDLALAEALASEAGYIGLIASRRRADVVLDHLRSRGHDAEALARVQAPAGIDLGRVTNAEIAIAVMADLVARRARGELRATAAPHQPRVEAIDPVCGMTVLVDDARHDDVDYWFCAAGCQRAFEADPASFLGGSPG